MSITVGEGNLSNTRLFTARLEKQVERRTSSTQPAHLYVDGHAVAILSTDHKSRLREQAEAKTLRFQCVKTAIARHQKNPPKAFGGMTLNFHVGHLDFSTIDRLHRFIYRQSELSPFGKLARSVVKPAP
ncbi:hypothetical protein K440DRAFT_195198 [Wilcoxina mikolae CBS 423.85]|nr:hypothetical protein K440DRAFT_195198 [Wilcoxina mikolae CBS 423.85]